MELDDLGEHLRFACLDTRNGSNGHNTTSCVIAVPSTSTPSGTLPQQVDDQAPGGLRDGLRDRPATLALGAARDLFLGPLAGVQFLLRRVFRPELFLHFSWHS